MLMIGLGVSSVLAATATVLGAYFYVSPSLPKALLRSSMSSDRSPR